MKADYIDSRIWFQSQWSNQIDFATLFSRWVKLANPEIGMLHVFSEFERTDSTEAWSRFQTGAFGGPLKKGLPNAGWAMAYGGAHADNIDVQEIAKAGFVTEMVGGAAIVRVTEKLSDVIDDFPMFSRKRAELKKLFPPDFFLIQDEPAIVK